MEINKFGTLLRPVRQLKENYAKFGTDWSKAVDLHKYHPFLAT